MNTKYDGDEFDDWNEDEERVEEEGDYVLNLSYFSKLNNNGTFGTRLGDRKPDVNSGYRVLYKCPSVGSVDSADQLLVLEEGWEPRWVQAEEARKKGLGGTSEPVTCFFSSLGLIRDLRIPGIFGHEDEEPLPRPTDLKLDFHELQDWKTGHTELVSPRIMPSGHKDVKSEAGKYFWMSNCRRLPKPRAEAKKS